MLFAGRLDLKANNNMTDTIPDISNKDIYKLLQDVHKKNIEIQNEMKENKDTITSEIKKLKHEFSNQISEVKKENDELKKENKELKIKLNAIERKIKKYSIIIYGLKDDQDNNEDLHKLIKIFNETLKIKCNFADFRDIYRFGNNLDGKVKPIALEVLNFHLKSELLSNAKKLKGTGIFLSQDFTSVDYNKRKVLNSNLKLAKNCNLDAKIQNNVLLIDQEKFTIEDLETETPHKILQAIQHQKNNSRHTNTQEVSCIKSQSSNNIRKGEVETLAKEKDISAGIKSKQEDTTDEVKPKRVTRLNYNKT